MHNETSMFSYTQEQLQELATCVLSHAKTLGATSCGTEFSEGVGLNVSVRQGKVDTLEHNHDKGVGVTVYIGQQRGNATTSDFSIEALKATVQAAYDIARFTAADDCAGLPETELLNNAPPQLELFHPWNIDAHDAITLANRAENAAFDVDKHIKNSDGASVAAHHSHFVLANSNGFNHGYAYSRHHIACAPIAKHKGLMQRDDWYSSQRDPSLLATPEAIGIYAAKRALARLHAQKIATGQYPILFDAPLAAGLLGSLVQATSGASLYRRSSFLLDALGKQVFANHLNLEEDPFIIKGIGSSPFDDEGVTTAKRTVIDAGVLQGYFLSCYTARKLGMRTTGNAGGSHNLILTSTKTQANDDLTAMLKKLHRGIFVTDLMGQGINYVTGDYSRGAFGYWVDNGIIQYPIEEFTIAGNLKDMFLNIQALGADTLIRGTKQTGSILIDNMMVAGS